MSGEAEKATQQELAAAQPASSTDAGNVSRPAGTSSVATSDVGKVAGDNGIVGQVTPAAAPVEPVVATPCLVAPDFEPGRVEEPEASKQSLASAGTTPSDQFKLAPTRSIALPSVSGTTASADQETPSITDGGGAAPQNTAERDVLSTKPAGVVTGEAETKKVTKRDGTADAPVVSANGNTRNEIFGMGEAPADKVTANEVEKTGKQAQVLGGSKRKVDEAFGDSNGDLGNTQATANISTTTAMDESETHIKKNVSSRPKRQKRERKILTPFGRTARKTRSQGPVEG